jgi:hypothetical protein
MLSPTLLGNVPARLILCFIVGAFCASCKPSDIRELLPGIALSDKCFALKISLAMPSPPNFIVLRRIHEIELFFHHIPLICGRCFIHLLYCNSCLQYDLVIQANSSQTLGLRSSDQVVDSDAEMDGSDGSFTRLCTTNVSCLCWVHTDGALKVSGMVKQSLSERAIR